MHLSRLLVLSLLALGLLLAAPDAQGTSLETTVSSSTVAAPPAPKDLVKDTVYITKTGKKYHRGTCRYLKKSKIAISRKKAENAAAGAPKTKADELPVQAAAEQKAAAKKSVEGREPLTLEGHSDWVLSVSFSPGGQRLACAREGSLEVWDVHSLTKSK